MFVSIGAILTEIVEKKVIFHRMRLVIASSRSMSIRMRMVGVVLVNKVHLVENIH